MVLACMPGPKVVWFDVVLDTVAKESLRTSRVGYL